MAFVKKLALGSIFISILSIFAMSHNAFAAETVIPLDNYKLLTSVDRESLYCSYDGQTYTQTGSCALTSANPNLKGLYTRNQYGFETGDIVEFDLNIFYRASTYTVGSQSASGSLLEGIRFLGAYPYSSNYTVLSVKETKSTLFNTDLNYYLDLRNANASITGNMEFSESVSYYSSYHFIILVKNTTLINLGVYNTVQSLFEANITDLGTNTPVYFTMTQVLLWRQSESKENKEVEEKTQGAVDDSQAAGGSSSSSAQQGGANLLSAITGFFNVITSAQPTNCRFNAPLNTYFGNERLNVDLCSLDLPSGIGALTSIIAIGILIPFAIHMFNKFIALFRSFQG